jgi:transcriptional regulator with XRE-family HTH domain
MSVITSRVTAVNSKDEAFFKALGERIAQARKVQGMTQTQLAELLGIAQQTMAHYEVGRLRLPTSMLPLLAQGLNVSVGELLGQPTARGTGKRGPASRLELQVERIAQLPMAKQRFVMEMLDTVLVQAGR